MLFVGGVEKGLVGTRSGISMEEMMGGMTGLPEFVELGRELGPLVRLVFYEGVEVVEPVGVEDVEGVALQLLAQATDLQQQALEGGIKEEQALF
jgi:hypothetical protein